MIESSTVDDLSYGEQVRLEIDGETLEGPVEGKYGYKEVQGKTLRLADSSVGFIFQGFNYAFTGTGLTTTVIQLTGYPNYVLEHGTLTRLEH